MGYRCQRNGKSTCVMMDLSIAGSLGRPVIYLLTSCARLARHTQHEMHPVNTYLSISLHLFPVGFYLMHTLNT